MASPPSRNTTPDSAFSLPTDTAPDMVSSPLTDTVPDVALSPLADLEDMPERVQPTRVNRWEQPTVEYVPDEDEEGAWQMYRCPSMRGMDSSPPPDTGDLSDQSTQAVDASNEDEQDVSRVDRQRIDSLNVLRRSPPQTPSYQGYYARNSAQMRKQKLDRLSAKFGRKRAGSLDEIDVQKDPKSMREQQPRLSVDDHGESSSGAGSSNTQTHSPSPVYEEHQESLETESMRSDHSDTTKPSLRTQNEARARSNSRNPPSSRSSSSSLRRPSLSPIISVDSPASSPSIIEHLPSAQPSLRTRDSDLSRTIITGTRTPLSLRNYDRIYGSRIPSPRLSYSASLRRASALSPRQSNTILRMTPVSSIHSRFGNALAKTLCCRPGSVTPIQPSRLPMRVKAIIPKYIKNKVGCLRKRKTARVELVPTAQRRHAMSPSLNSAVSPAGDAMSSSSGSTHTQGKLTGAVPLSNMIVRSDDSVRDTPPLPPPSDGGLGAMMKRLSLDDLPLHKDERAEITRLMRDIERDSREPVAHPYRLSKEEDDEIRRQVENRVKEINDNAEKEVLDRRNRERALRANTWPAPSSSRSRRPPHAPNGDDVVAPRVMNGDHITRPQYRQRQTPRVSSESLARSSLRHVRFVEEGEEDHPFTNGDGVERDGILQ